MAPLTRKQLYELVWKRPMVEVAKEYGLSDRGLAKLCERNGIPVPPRGWWARKKAGYNVKKMPLIDINPKEAGTTILIEKAVFEESTEEVQDVLPSEIQEAIAQEELPKNRIKVPGSLMKPHPIVAQWIETERVRSESYRKWGGDRGFDTVTSVERRRRRIISAFLKALEERGFKTERDRDYYSKNIWIYYHQDRIAFTVWEHISHVRRKLTEEEKKESMNSERQWSQIREPSGRLVLRLSAEPLKWGMHKEFSDKNPEFLESQMNKIMIAAIELIWKVKKERLIAREESHRRWEEQKQKDREAALLKAEQARKGMLERKAANWKKAKDIREYVAAVAQAVVNGGSLADTTALDHWKRWALTHANDIDPIVSGDPLIALGENLLEQED